MILPRQRSYFAALLVSETNKQPPYLQSVCISTNYNASKLIKFQQIWQTNIVFVSWVTWLASLVPGPTILKRISFFRICKFLNNLIYKFVNGSLICVFRFEAMESLFSIWFFISNHLRHSFPSSRWPTWFRGYLISCSVTPNLN